MIILSFIITTGVLSILIIILWKIVNKIKFLKGRKVLKTIVIILGVIGTYFLIITIFFTALDYERNIDFDETVWKNEIRERSKMLEDLLHSNYLIGKKTSEIRDVFGKPYKINIDEGSMTYELVGDHGFLEIKVVYLRLHLNDSTVMNFDYETVYDD